MCAASLIKTGEKISDVCEKTGFNDQHYFHRCLRKHLDVRRQIIEMKMVKISRDFMKY